MSPNSSAAFNNSIILSSKNNTSENLHDDLQLLLQKKTLASEELKGIYYLYLGILRNFIVVCICRIRK